MMLNHSVLDRQNAKQAPAPIRILSDNKDKPAKRGWQRSW